MSEANISLPTDISERWERSYREMLGVLGAYLYGDPHRDDPQYEVLRIAELEIISDAMRQVYGAVVGSAPGEARFNYLIRNPQSVAGWKKVVRVARAVAGLRERYRPAAFIRPDRDVCSFHSSPLLRAYARERSTKPVLMSHGDWFVPAEKADLVRTPGFGREMLDFLSDATRRAFLAADVGRKFSPDLAERSYARLSQWTNFHFQHVMRRGMRLPREFWAGTMGFPLHRIFARAVRLNGGAVVGFDHGAGSGMFKWDYQPRHEFGFVDRFVSFGPAMAEGLKANAEVCGLEFAKVRIESVSEIRSVNRGGISRKPTKAAYIASQYCGDKFMSPPFCDNERLFDWQHRLLSFLKSTGLDIAIKPHPEDTQKPAEKISADLDIDILNGRFENIDWQDTIFFFDTPLSSAFSAALASGMPIVLFDVPHLTRRTLAQGMLERRVSIAPAWYDDSKRIQTDWKNLGATIDRALSLDSDELLKRFYGVETKRASY